MQLRKATRQLNRAARLGKNAATEPLINDEEALRMALLAAFPDRVAQRRAPASRQLRMQDGGGAELDETSVVREGMLLIAVDATDASERGRGRRVVVRSAVEIDADHLLEVTADAVQAREEYRFDAQTETAVRWSALTYGDIVLDESLSHEVSGDRAAAVLFGAAKERGLNAFFDFDELSRLTARIEFVRSLARGDGDLMGAVDDSAIDAALLDLCQGARSFADLKRASLTDALWARMAEHRSQVERLAPEAVSLPGRKRAPVRYEVGRPPFVASRLQDFFGLKDGPRIADGAVPLVLHLLAPNGRAVQVTTDLAGFWERAYREQRRALMRRYSRHSWPEDPSESAKDRSR